MGQHNFAFKTLFYGDLALRVVHSKRTDMGGQFRHVALFHPTHSEDSAYDSILITSWYIGTGQSNIRED
jgi:hypothetical protein